MIRTVPLLRRTALGLFLITVLALAIATRGCTRWPETFVGSGPSMEPTVRPGEYFTVTSPVEGLRRGMLVIFRFEDDEGTVHHVLRRLAGLPGDTVAMREGRAIVNGAATDWPYRVLEPRASRSHLARVADLYTWGPVVVPPDSVFLLSDTRDIVGWPDSRFIGPIPVSALEGAAGRYLWSRQPGRILRRLR